jgi:hypothetical protein
MSGPGRVLNDLDFVDFYSFCYRVLGELVGRSVPDVSTFQAAFEVLEGMLVRRKGTSNPVIAAFFVRIGALASGCESPACTLACLSFLSQLVDRYPFLRSLVVDPPNERATSGVYCPSAEDPYLANAMASNPGGDLALLCQHWHPDVRTSAKLFVADLARDDPGMIGRKMRLVPWKDCLERWDWKDGTQFVPDWEQGLSTSAPKNMNKRKDLASSNGEVDSHTSSKKARFDKSSSSNSNGYKKSYGSTRGRGGKRGRGRGSFRGRSSFRDSRS